MRNKDLRLQIIKKFEAIKRLEEEQKQIEQKIDNILRGISCKKEA